MFVLAVSDLELELESGAGVAFPPHTMPLSPHLVLFALHILSRSALIILRARISACFPFRYDLFTAKHPSARIRSLSIEHSQEFRQLCRSLCLMFTVRHFLLVQINKEFQKSRVQVKTWVSRVFVQRSHKLWSRPLSFRQRCSISEQRERLNVCCWNSKN